ncbi:MAG TPA: hypothetical protein VHP58_06150 [Alphaproteobacteria bacterium]|nr:hypothetical protein [Alphaproteobacteria bacterium]
MNIFQRPPPHGEEAEALKGMTKSVGERLKKDLPPETTLPEHLQALVNKLDGPTPD